MMGGGEMVCTVDIFGVHYDNYISDVCIHKII